MLKRILKNDFLKNRVISFILFLSIALSAFLVASSFHMTMELTGSLSSLFEKSKAPDFVQMHVGEIEQEEIDSWSSSNEMVLKEQIVQMVNIDNTNIDFGSQQDNAIAIMDNYFVSQNLNFDYLLDMYSDIVDVSPGEVALPLYYKEQYNIELGETIVIHDKNFSRELTVTDFVRDVQMNPSIIHSKRFVVHEDDLKELQSHVGDVEYAIEFLLKDDANLNAFHSMYESSELPHQGPTIDYPLIKTLNAITDGIVIALIIFVSILLIIVSALCIRYTIVSTMEEDFREIGIMKAIGIPEKNIKHIYLIKYVAISVIASVVGYIVSLFLKNVFTSHISLYLGTAPTSIYTIFIPILAILILFTFIVLYCLFVFRKFRNITAVDSLQSARTQRFKQRKKHMAISKSKVLNINILLGIKDVFSRLKMYILLFLVFVISSFIIIVPVNFLNTVESNEFIQYMGIEKSDIRIDLQHSDHMEDTYNNMISILEKDKDVSKYAAYITNKYEYIGENGLSESIIIESGNFSAFPLEYVHGKEPAIEDDLALSYLNAKEMDKKVGDTLELIVDGEKRTMNICGIYQDVTNGGRTAKANLPSEKDDALRYELSVDVGDSTSKSAKMGEYRDTFQEATVTDINGYLHQTFGNTIDQLRLFTFIAIAIALIIAGLFTSLFLRMLIAKDSPHIAIMKTIGFSNRDIRIQYITRSLCVLAAGVISGTIIANTVGPVIIGGLLSIMGAANISFVIDPFQAYILSPFVMAAVVIIVASVNLVSIKNVEITDMKDG